MGVSLITRIKGFLNLRKFNAVRVSRLLCIEFAINARVLSEHGIITIELKS